MTAFRTVQVPVSQKGRAHGPPTTVNEMLTAPPISVMPTDMVLRLPSARRQRCLAPSNRPLRHLSKMCFEQRLFRSVPGISRARSPSLTNIDVDQRNDGAVFAASFGRQSRAEGRLHGYAHCVALDFHRLALRSLRGSSFDADLGRCIWRRYCCAALSSIIVLRLSRLCWSGAVV